MPSPRKRGIVALLLGAMVAAATLTVTSTSEPDTTVVAAAASEPVIFQFQDDDERQTVLAARAATTTTTTAPPTTTTTHRPSITTTQPAPPSGSGDPHDPATWDRLAQCESGGNWSANTGNGYYGGIQFSLSSWEGVGGTGYPHEHPKSEQIARGKLLWEQGGWKHWPACTRSFGWR